MLAGDNSILQKATQSKEKTERATIIETAQTDILGQIAENKGNDISKKQLATILNKQFNTVDENKIPDEVSSEQEHDLKLTTIDKKYTINLSEIFKGRLASENVVETFGEKYEDSMIGKTIDYKSGKNNINEWIILGKKINEQGKKDILITTKNPVSTQEIQNTLAEWIGYEEKINNACKNYVGETGTLGTKSALIKNVRSITLEDINNAVGFKEIINSVTISNSNGGCAYPNSEGNGWIKNTDDTYLSYTFPTEGYYYYNDNGAYKFGSLTNNFSNETIILEKPNNMNYIKANNETYWVASRSVTVNQGFAGFWVEYVGYGFIGGDTGSICYSNSNGGNEPGGRQSKTIRPLIILSSEIPWNDVKNLIGDYATYD